MGTMSIMGRRGDTKVTWNPDNDTEVKAAKAQFATLVKDSKFRAFRVDREGEPGEEMDKFDKTAGKVIMVPPMAGGCA